MGGDKGTKLPPWVACRLPMLGTGQTRPQLFRLLPLFVLYGVIAATVYLIAGLGQWSPGFTPIGRSLALSVGFLFLPSLVEELVWRWALISPRVIEQSTASAARSVLLSTVIFTAAHPLAAVSFVPHARETFFQPAFLAIVFLLGLTCGTSYVWSKSIWPPVVIHWVTVLAWKFLLGGPFIMLGR